MSAKIKNRGLATHKHSHRPKGISHHAFNKVYWPYLPLVLLISALTILGVRSGSIFNSIRHPGGEVLAYSTSMEPAKLLAETNAQRAGNNENNLSLDGSLGAAAQAKANDMAKRDYWSHVTPDGNQPWLFFTASGYQYQKAGENLAAGFESESSVINAWMASGPHRHNLLDPAYKDVGFGVANVADYRAAGGGPMTVVVAFYGDPVGNYDQPVVTSSASSGFNSTATIQSSYDKSQKSTRADLSFASFHVYSWASITALMFMAAALIIWASRHVLAIHKVVAKGESFAFHHPLVDVGLLMIAALAFLLNQTAGFIK